MKKTIVKIDGMMCPMCESHINEIIRKEFEVKKVNSSHHKGEAVILSETDLDEEALYRAIDSTGYRVLSVESGPYRKSGLLGIFGK